MASYLITERERKSVRTYIKIENVFNERYYESGVAGAWRRRRRWAPFRVLTYKQPPRNDGRRL